MGYKFGWKPPRPEQLASAPKYKVCPRLKANLPSSVDLRSKFPTPFDQGDLGSCTANMSAGMVVYDQGLEGLPVVTPSRLFDYFNSRKLEGTTSQDAGASIADAVKALADYGFCPETEWTYDVSKFAQTPSSACYSDAAPNVVKDYFNVPQDLDTIRAALAAGEPVGIGVVVYQSFMTPDASGTVPVPSIVEQMGQPLGGHAILLVGYDDSKQAFLFRNSWGTGWGLGGYAYLPYQYVLSQSLASDFWVIRTIPGAQPAPTPTPSPSPSPSPSPTPIPTPGPGTMQQFIDGLFTQIKAMLAGHPVALAFVSLLQAQIDALFTQQGGGAPSFGSLSPAQIKALADLALGMAAKIFAGNPAAAAVITALTFAIDSLLASQGAKLSTGTLTPAQIQQLLDSVLSVLASVFAGNPMAVEIIGYVQTALDAVLAGKKAA